jgi:hypothetical protein
LVFQYRQETLEQAARAALNLDRYADAEAAGRALLAAHDSTYGAPDEAVWGRVLLAQAIAAQGRKAEAMKTLEPALARYRDLQAQGAAYVGFRQHFARALYVQALAEPADSGGIARSHEALDQAAALLQGLTEEARQLYDTKQLRSWIAAAQKNLDPDAQSQKP